MINFYFWALVLLIALPMLGVVKRPERIYHYPYFMTAGFAIFILPQAISLIRFPGVAQPSAVEAVLLVACLCLAMVLLSSRFPTSRWIATHTMAALHEGRLFQAGVGLVLIGHIASYLQNQAALELSGQVWTGRVTIYHFFASLLIPGFAIALRTALRGGRLLPWLVALAAAGPPVMAALFYGRRETAAMLLITIALTLYYRWRLRPPRLLVGVTIVLAMLLIPATANYRSLTSRHGLAGLQQLDLVGNFESFIGEPSILELRNAAMLIEAVDRRGSYEWGTGYWDELVWRFVPAQLVGADTKQSLMVDATGGALVFEMWRMGYFMPTGTTITGIGDGYLQFGFFGSLFFLVLGIGVRSLWGASLEPNGVFAQLLYICTLTSALRAITHQTAGYLPSLLFYLIFLGLAVWYARERVDAKSLRIAQRRPAHAT